MFGYEILLPITYPSIVTMKDAAPVIFACQLSFFTLSEIFGRRGGGLSQTRESVYFRLELRRDFSGRHPGIFVAWPAREDPSAVPMSLESVYFDENNDWQHLCVADGRG